MNRTINRMLLFVVMILLAGCASTKTKWFDGTKSVIPKENEPVPIVTFEF